MKRGGQWKITALLACLIFLILALVIGKFGKSSYDNAPPVLLLFFGLFLAFVSIFIAKIALLIWAILRYFFAEREPIIEFQHPVFGKMKREMRLWSGKITLADKPIPFCVDGRADQPSERLLLHLQGILDNFAQIEAEALSFALSKEPTLANVKLVPCSINILDEEHPDTFTLELIADDDDSRVWYMDFVNGKPKEFGFDD